MAQLQTGQLLAKAQPGTVTRSTAERKVSRSGYANTGAQTGAVSRSLIQEPLERPIAPGTNKVINVKPIIEQARDEDLSKSTPAVRTIGPRFIGGPDFSSVQFSPEQQSRFENNVLRSTAEANPTAQSPQSQPRFRIANGQQYQIQADGFDTTELGRRLASMKNEGKSLSTSKKFTKLYNRYKDGGTVRTGYRTQEEADQAGARQKAQRAQEARAVARMNLGGAVREGRVSPDVTTEQFQAGVRTPPSQTPPTPETTQAVSDYNNQAQSQGEVLGTSVEQPQNIIDSFNLLPSEQKSEINAQANFASQNLRSIEEEYKSEEAYLKKALDARAQLESNESVFPEEKEYLMNNYNRIISEQEAKLKGLEDSYNENNNILRSIQSQFGF